jgi:uncharacterized membrane protein
LTPVVKRSRDNGPEDSEFLLSPNRSFSWSEARWFLVPVFVISLAIGFGFLLMGYWMILPFAGLELTFLAAVLGWFRLTGCERERVIFAGDRLIIAKERGGQSAEADWVFQRAWARVVVSRPARGNQPCRLGIRSHGRTVEVGRFLPERERAQLARELGLLLSTLP